MPMASRVHEWADMQRCRWSAAWHDALAKSLLSMRDLLGANGPLPDRIHPVAPVTIDADPALAEAILEGRYVFGSDVVDVETARAPWSAAAPTPAWAETLHGFAWLEHFQVLDDKAAAEEARARIDSWMTEKGQWDAIAWRPHVTARRLISWFVHARMILSGADLVWRSSLLRNISRQAAHLSRTARWAQDGAPRMTAAIGLAMSGVSLPHGEARRDKGLAMVAEELGRQILPDGGHVSRSPETLLRILIDLVNLKSVMGQQRMNLPEPIQHALDRIFPMVRFFRHGDGGLAYFNGAAPLDAEQVDAVLTHDETGGRPVSQANQSGYQRLVREETCILIDAGAPPQSTLGAHAHAGCLSFEMSHGPQRIVVNCGATHAHGPDWEAALRATAAHSTLAIADTSSCSFYPFDPSADYEDGRVIAGPREIACDRRETGEGAAFLASHDGYARRFGVRHSRRIFLSADGRSVRGEDLLGPSAGRSTVGRGRDAAFTVRFHLHPDVEAELGSGAGGVTLVLPGGTQWRFEAEGANVSIADTAYIDHGARIRKARQIVLQSVVEREKTLVHWRFVLVEPELRASLGRTRPEAGHLRVPLKKQGEGRAPISVLKRLGRLNAASLGSRVPECRPVADAPDNPLHHLREGGAGLHDADFAPEDEWPTLSAEDVKPMETAD